MDYGFQSGVPGFISRRVGQTKRKSQLYSADAVHNGRSAPIVSGEVLTLMEGSRRKNSKYYQLLPFVKLLLDLISN